MVVDKEAVTDALRARGDHDKALLAETALSRSVDLERDASTLRQLDVDNAEIEAAAEAHEAHED